MTTAKIALLALAAALVAGPVAQASARETSKTAKVELKTAAPVAAPAIDARVQRMQVAINPQPLPPREEDD
jgi:hypothetical protein